MRSAEEDANLRLIERLYADVLGPMDSQTVEQYFAPGFVQHSPGIASGVPAFKDWLDRTKAVHPRTRCAVKRMMADGDLILAHVHIVLEPGDVGVAAMSLFRIANGLVSEYWDVVQPVEPRPRNANGMF